MLSKNLKIVCLDITEDFYNYRGTFRLCDDENYMDMDLIDLTDSKINEIKDVFNLGESAGEIKKEIMSKVLEATKIECRYEEGKKEILGE